MTVDNLTNNVGGKNIISILYPLYSGEMNRVNRGPIDGQVANSAGQPIKEFRNAKKILKYLIFKELRVLCPDIGSYLKYILCVGRTL